jgi:hypothetical protein
MECIECFLSFHNDIAWLRRQFLDDFRTRSPAQQAPVPQSASYQFQCREGLHMPGPPFFNSGKPSSKGWNGQ